MSPYHTGPVTQGHAPAGARERWHDPTPRVSNEQTPPRRVSSWGYNRTRPARLRLGAAASTTDSVPSPRTAAHERRRQTGCPSECPGGDYGRAASARAKMRAPSQDGHDRGEAGCKMTSSKKGGRGALSRLCRWYIEVQVYKHGAQLAANDQLRRRRGCVPCGYISQTRPSPIQSKKY